MQTANQNVYYVYIAANAEHTVLDTGSTGNLASRLYELKYGLYKGSYHPECFHLIYLECFADPSQAIKRQNVLEKLPMRKKMKLVESANLAKKFLNEKILDDTGAI